MVIIKKQSKEVLSQKRMEGLLKLAEIIQWGRKNPLKFCHRFFAIELLDYQAYVFMNSWITPYNLWCQSRGSGKALSLDTIIQTPYGSKKMIDIKVGDFVLGQDGKPTKVINTSEIFLNHDCYEVTFEDGEKIIADGDHLWNIKVRWQDEHKIFTTREMLNKFNQPYTRHGIMGDNYVYKVPMPCPIEYDEVNLPIDPYALGLWLGDGNSGDTRITCSNLDLDNIVENLQKTKHPIKVYQRPRNVSSIGVGVTPRGQINYVRKAMLDLNLIKNKHIPDLYMYSSIEQRTELLKGLMDSDGTVDKSGHCEFYQKSYNFILSVSRLLSSLSIKNYIREKRVKHNGEILLHHVVSFTVGSENQCFKLRRKMERLRPANIRTKYKTIFNIKKVDSVPTKCISVDNEKQLYLCGDKFTVTHNSTIGAPFIMAKNMLFPNHKTYIMSGDGSQSKEMFLKIEKIAKNEVESFLDLNDIFLNETVKNSSTSSGFTHNPNSYEYNLYNGSATYTLNSIIDNLRSKRSQLNFYDEGGFIDEEFYAATEPFTIINSDFKMGGGKDITLRAPQVPNQIIYASSASGIETYYFKKYKEFAKKMFLGDDRYFVADIGCDIVLKATQYGETYPVPLLTKETIDAKTRENPEKANREYRNIFSREGGETQAIKRALIIKNSESRPPKLTNDGNNRTKNSKFLIIYDPARSDDNSVSLVFELYLDNNVGYKLDIVNAVSFSDLDKKKRTPLRTPEQLEKLKHMILDYNGVQSADYENIEMLLIDAGAGGGGVNIGDYLMENWVDNKGFSHKGLLDYTYKENEVYKKKFPDAVDKCRLLIPKGLRTQMFDAMVEMIKLDLVSFPRDYDMKGYITIFEDSNFTNNDGKKEIEQKSKMYKLSEDEEFALKQIDLLKEEIVNIHRYKGDGTYKYSLSADKKNKLNDDRAFCCAMACWYLSEKRRENITKKSEKKVDWSKYILGR